MLFGLLFQHIFLNDGILAILTLPSHFYNICVRSSFVSKCYFVKMNCYFDCNCNLFFLMMKKVAFSYYLSHFLSKTTSSFRFVYRCINCKVDLLHYCNIQICCLCFKGCNIVCNLIKNCTLNHLL